MECAICHHQIKSKKFWSCSTCNNKLHHICYEKWLCYSDTCPYCRTNPNNNINKNCRNIFCCFFILNAAGHINDVLQRA